MTPGLMSNSPFDLQTYTKKWKENLAVHQRSLGALFQAPLQIRIARLTVIKEILF